MPIPVTVTGPAANGAIDHVKSMLSPTRADDWVSAALVSQGEYGVPKGLVFGYPCRTDGKGGYTVVPEQFIAQLIAALNDQVAIRSLATKITIDKAAALLNLLQQSAESAHGGA